MELKQHIKGVLIAIFSATVILFAISFFVGSQIVVHRDIVVNADKSAVFNYVKQPKNFPNWMEGTDGIVVKETTNGNGIQYIGFDEKLHTFKYLVSETASGVEISYQRNNELTAIFKLQVKQKSDGSVLFYEKIWNVSNNPLTKIFSLSMDEDIEMGMKKELMNVKFLIEEAKTIK
jgi:hypothetical protein